MRKIAQAVAGLSLALVLGLAGRADAQVMADRVPAEALAYFSWEGIGSNPGAQYEGSKLAAIVEETGLGRFLVEDAPGLIAGAGVPGEKGPREFAEALRIMTQAIQRPAMMYLLPPREEDGEPFVVAMMDFGPDAEGVLKQILQRFGEPEDDLAYGREGNILWVSTGKLGKPDLAPAQSIGATPAFSRSAKAVKGPQGEGLLYMHLNLQGIKAIALAEASREDPDVPAAKLLSALGLDSVESLSFGGRFDRGDWVGDLLLSMPGERAGLLKALFPGTPQTDAVANVPADALWMKTYRFDIPAVFESAVAAAEIVLPGAKEKAPAVWNWAGAATGVRVKDDLVDQLSPDWVAFEGSKGWVLINGTKNGPAVARAIEGLARAGQRFLLMSQPKGQPVQARLIIEPQTVDDASVMTLKVEGEAAKQVPFSLVWGSSGNVIAFGTSAEAVAAGLQPASGGGLLAKPEVQALRTRLGAPTGALIDYADLPRTFPEVISMLKSAEPLIKEENPDFDTAAVVSKLEVVGRHLAPTMAASWVDEQGYHLRSVAPFPGAEVLSSVGRSGSTMFREAVPMLLEQRARQKQQLAAADLRMLGFNLADYASSHDGKFPDKWSVLAKENGLDVDMFLLRGSGTVVPPEVRDGTEEQRLAWIDQSSDYVYVGAGKSMPQNGDDGSKTVIAHSRIKPGSTARVHVLFADGHVDLLDQPALEALLKN